MADPSPTLGELFKAKAVTDEQVNAAVEVSLADPQTGAYPIADGFMLDLAAAVAGHRGASEAVAVMPATEAGRIGADAAAMAVLRALEIVEQGSSLVPA